MLILWIHDNTSNFSMSVFYNWIIHSIELERLIWLKKGEYKKNYSTTFDEQYVMPRFHHDFWFKCGEFGLGKAKTFLKTILAV